MKEVKIRLYNNNVINCIVNDAIIGLQSNGQIIYETKRLVENDCGDFLFTKDLIKISKKLKDINDFNKKVVMLNVMTESLLYKKLDLNIENRFVDNKNETITDNATGLIWQKEAASKMYKWKDALKYAKNLSFAGHSGWRLPDINELYSLVDKTKRSPAIDAAFSDTKSDYYWSSSPYTSNTIGAWAVHFDNGYVYHYLKDYNGYVRCVFLII